MFCLIEDNKGISGIVKTITNRTEKQEHMGYNAQLRNVVNYVSSYLQ
jgi:hypothetical protein